MKVIFNADDYGLTVGVNDGVIKAFVDGVVTSATIMMNQPAVEDALKKARIYGISVGCHIDLDKGRALTGVSSLTDKKGHFLASRKLHDVDEEDVYQEVKAQIEMLSSMYRAPSHIDSHHHVHMRIDPIGNAVRRIAAELELPYRRKDRLVENFYGLKNIVPKKLISILQQQDHGFVEVMCHPAYPDVELHKTSSYCFERGIELKTLTSDEIKDYVKESEIMLTNYEDILASEL